MDNQAILKKLHAYQELIEDLINLNLYTVDTDYDYDDNLVEYYYPFDMTEYIDEWMKEHHTKILLKKIQKK